MNSPNYNKNNRKADNKNKMNLVDDSDFVNKATQRNVHTISNNASFVRPIQKSNQTTT